jgi:uncharacterized membrane protein
MRRWFPLTLIVATLAFSLAVYSRLPDSMTVHWSVTGEPDRYGSRAVGALLLPFIMIGMWGLLLALPKLDPRSAHIEKFRDTYDLFVIAVIGVMGLLHVGILGSALGWPIQVGRLAPVAIGALFVILGNLLPRFRSNFFFGIRTPWTLSSESVWARTHRVGGYMMIIVGLLLVLAGMLGTSRWLIVAISGAAAMVTGVLVYSYVIWRAEQQSR